jgi:hypothetical protein
MLMNVVDPFVPSCVQDRLAQNLMNMLKSEWMKALMVAGGWSAHKWSVLPAEVDGSVEV